MNFLINKDYSWKELMKTLQSHDNTIIKDDKEITAKLKNKKVKKFTETYKFQLYHYLLNSTSGDVRSKVLTNEQDKVFESYRYLHRKGRNRTEDTVLDLHAKVMSPDAAKTEE